MRHQVGVPEGQVQHGLHRLTFSNRVILTPGGLTVSPASISSQDELRVEWATVPTTLTPRHGLGPSTVARFFQAEKSRAPVLVVPRRQGGTTEAKSSFSPLSPFLLSGLLSPVHPLHTLYPESGTVLTMSFTSQRRTHISMKTAELLPKELGDAMCWPVASPSTVPRTRLPPTYPLMPAPA